MQRVTKRGRETFLDLRHGVPQADTYRRVFERIAPCSSTPMFSPMGEPGGGSALEQVVPIDGKSVKGSYERNKKQSALHLVSAWASWHRVLLGQVKVADKSNEITAIPDLLELLDITGCNQSD